MEKVHLMRYDTKIKVLRDGSVRTKLYNSVITRDLQLFEEDDISDTSNGSIVGRVASDKLSDDDTVRQDSLIRSRNLIIDYACQNCDCWKSFVTLTFAENVKDLDIANSIFNKYCTQVRRACKKLGFEFMYLGTIEFQKRGAVHYHLLTNLVPGSDLLPFQRDTTNKKMYDAKYWKDGFSSAFDVINDTDENFNIALYIVKYIYKDLDNRLYGRTRVLKSNNLEKPIEFELMSNDNTYQNAIDYIKQKKYDVTNVYRTAQSDDKPYIIPFTAIDYKSQDDNSTLLEILQNDLQF